MVPGLRKSVLPKDPGSVHDTHMVTHNHINSSPKDLIPSSDLLGNHAHTCTQAKCPFTLI